MTREPAPGALTGRILVVDDDIVLTQGLRMGLERQGYRVSVINDGTGAVDAALASQAELILLDVMMPGLDGWSVLAQIRAHPDTRRIPVIMLTAVDAGASKVKGFELGADDYVTKPFNLAELRCRIAAILRRSVASAPADSVTIPVVSGASGIELVGGGDVRFVEGIRNYTYVHTRDSRYLCRLSLGELEEREVPGFMRVHRSFIVNLDRVHGCGWEGSSSFRLRLDDDAGSSIPVSRSLITEVQRRLGIKD